MSCRTTMSATPAPAAPSVHGSQQLLVPTWCVTGVLQRALEALILPLEVLNLGCAVLAAAAQVLELQREGCSKGKHRVSCGRLQPDGFGGLLPEHTSRCSRSRCKLPLRAVRTISLGQIAPASGLQGIQRSDGRWDWQPLRCSSEVEAKRHGFHETQLQQQLEGDPQVLKRRLVPCPQHLRTVQHLPGIPACLLHF